MNDSLGMSASWYAATAAPAPVRAPLVGEVDADLVIVGGGATGLSAALTAAEAGARAVLLEGGRIGWGASGRNGGQIIPGLRKGAAELVQRFGPERGRALFELALEARTLIERRIAEHAIACDFRPTGHLHGAIKARQMREFEGEARALEAIGYRDAVVLDRAEARAEVDTSYHGALLDRRGGHFHTLNYTLGLAGAAEFAGASLYERSRVHAVERHGAGVVARTADSTVRAKAALMAGDALVQGIPAARPAWIMPVANYIVATAPLPDPTGLIANDRAVSDARFVVNYYRRTPDGRLMFGGGERYSRKPPADIAAFVRPFLARTFPRLADVRIDHAWGGLVSVTMSRLPDIGRDGPILWAHGYSGQGAILSTLGGALMAEAALGQQGGGGLDRFAAVAPPPFPGGAGLRGPLHVLGMLWFAMKDRLP